MDTSGQTTVIRLNQAKAFWKYNGLIFKTKNKNEYKFGNDKQIAIGSFSIKVLSKAIPSLQKELMLGIWTLRVLLN